MGWDLSGRKIPTKFYQLKRADLAEGRSIRRGRNEPPEAKARLSIGALTCLRDFANADLDKPAIILSQRPSSHDAEGSRAFRKAAARVQPGLGRAPRPRRAPAVASGAWYPAGARHRGTEEVEITPGMGRRSVSGRLEDKANRALSAR